MAILLAMAHSANPQQSNSPMVCFLAILAALHMRGVDVSDQFSNDRLDDDVATRVHAHIFVHSIFFFVGINKDVCNNYFLAHHFLFGVSQPAVGVPQRESSIGVAG